MLKHTPHETSLTTINTDVHECHNITVIDHNYAHPYYRHSLVKIELFLVFCDIALFPTVNFSNSSQHPHSQGRNGNRVRYLHLSTYDTNLLAKLITTTNNTVHYRILSVLM